MKYKISILTIGLGLLLFPACRKCTTCEVLDAGESKYEYPETCGSKQQIDDYEANCETEYGQYGFTCSCSTD